MKKTVIILTGILIELSSCTNKSIVTCGSGDLESRPNIAGEVLQLKRIAIADTTIASISGEIFGKDSSANGVTIDTLVGTLVYLIDTKNGKTYSSQTNIHGKYQYYVPASTYDLKVQYIAYNILIVRNVIIGTGDMIQFNAVLGQCGTEQDSTIFLMQQDKTTKRIKGW